MCFFTLVASDYLLIPGCCRLLGRRRRHKVPIHNPWQRHHPSGKRFWRNWKIGPAKIAVPAAKPTKTPTTTAACCDSSRHETSSAKPLQKLQTLRGFFHLVNRDSYCFQTHHASYDYDTVIYIHYPSSLAIQVELPAQHGRPRVPRGWGLRVRHCPKQASTSTPKFIMSIEGS